MMITIARDFVHEIEIKKSRFICQMGRVRTEEEARAFILAVKKEHYKANHNCSAFVLGERQEVQRTSDDGEPSGTAGVPMLEVLKKRAVTDVCVVVTRYFGGIKLGAGGLIRAYAGSVAAGLEACGLVKLVEQRELRLELEYGLFDRLNKFLKMPIAESVFTDKVGVTVFLDEAEVPGFLADLTDRFSGKIAVEEGGKRFVEEAI